MGKYWISSKSSNMTTNIISESIRSCVLAQNIKNNFGEIRFPKTVLPIPKIQTNH